MPMLVVRQDATIANANQNVLELLGLNFSDVQGTHVSLLMNQSKREVERMIDQNHRDILQTSIPNSDRFIGWRQPPGLPGLRGRVARHGLPQTPPQGEYPAQAAECCALCRQ